VKKNILMSLYSAIWRVERRIYANFLLSVPAKEF